MSGRKVRRRALDLVPALAPEWLTPVRASTAIVAFGASLTTALLTAWIPAPGLLRFGLVGLASLVCGPLAYWASDAASPSPAVSRSVAAGALHTAFSGGILLPLFVMLESVPGKTAW